MRRSRNFLKHTNSQQPKAVPDSFAKVVGPTSESVSEVQIQESTISSVPNSAPNPVLKPVLEPSPGLPQVKNTYARIIKLSKLCPCVGPFPSVGLTLTWFIWDRNLALHITLYSVNYV